MTSTLELRLLGAPEVLLDGEPVRFRSRKVLALLAYLAVEGGSHRREKLIDLLWPESAAEGGAATLRSTLSRLRSALGSAAETLVTEGGSVSLERRAGQTVDVLELAALQEAPTRLAAERLDAVTRGAFLEGFSVDASAEFDEWVSRWTSSCQGRVGSLLEQVARWYIDTGRLDEAEAAIGRWASVVPFDDLPVTHLIELHARRGSVAAALQAYDQHVAVLREELGAAPGATLARLVERVRGGESPEEDPGRRLRSLIARGSAELAEGRATAALTQLDEALGLLEGVDDGIASEVTDELYRERGRALEQANRFPEARANYEALGERGRDHSNMSWQLSSLVGLAVLHATPTALADADLASEAATRAVDLARLLGDRESEARALWALVLTEHYALGDEEAALEHGLAGLRAARQVDFSATLPFLLNDVHWVQATLGQLGEAVALLDEAIAEWDRRGNVEMLTDSLNGAGLLYTLTGEFERALETAERAGALAREANNVWNQLAVNANLTLLHRERGDHEQAISALRAAVDVSTTEAPGASPYYQLLLAVVLSDLGPLDEVEEISAALDAQAEGLPPFWRVADTVETLRVRARLFRGEATADDLDRVSGFASEVVGLVPVGVLAPLVAGEVALALGAHERAITLADAYLEAADRSSARVGRADALLIRGQAAATGDAQRGLADLEGAELEAAGLGAERVRWRIAAVLAEARAGLGDDEGAAEARAGAVAGYAVVRGQVPRGRYRDAFDAASPAPSG